MKLILMRHGHAQEPTSMNQSDHDRPLTSRGKKEATVTAQWLRTKGIIPTMVVASSAVRVQETLGEVLKEFPDLQVSTKSDLYMASPKIYRAHLGKLGQGDVLMIGHNPGISALASDMSGQDVYFRTAEAMVLEFEDDSWVNPAEGVTEPRNCHFAR